MDNQETREVTKTYADGSTVTMTIDCKTGALLDYNATPPPPRTTGDGLQEIVEDIMLPDGTRDGDIGRIGLAITQKQDTGKPLFRVVGKDVKTFFCERIPFDTSFLGRVDPETEEALKKDPDAKKRVSPTGFFPQDTLCNLQAQR